VIDLHLHTTASDGLLQPATLVDRAAEAGLTIVAITDHDTTAGVDEASAAAAARNLRVVPGIEITAVEHGRDVHILGYFLNTRCAVLTEFLAAQRADRLRRVAAMADKLTALGCRIDLEGLLADGAGSSRSVGRPALADALVAGGHAADRSDAFARLLGRGKPAFVPRTGVAGADVIAVIHAAAGIASLAHPGIMHDDEAVRALAAVGLDALEVWHSDHSADDQQRYYQLAAELGLARSGGSDYHGDGVHRACRLGGISIPPDEFARLESAAGARR
jgi:hypothetical protein